MPIGCVRFAKYCDKMYSRHIFPYGRFQFFGEHKKRTVNTSRDVGSSCTRMIISSSFGVLGVY